LLLHLQVVHNEDWQNSHGEITHRGEGTVNICHGNDFHVNARAFTRDIPDWVISQSSPKKGQWLALQQHEEHEHQSSKDCQDHDGIEEQNMRPVEANTHQENTNSDLAENRCETESNFAEPPVLAES
jgi:hypothetical protein